MAKLLLRVCHYNSPFRLTGTRQVPNIFGTKGFRSGINGSVRETWSQRERRRQHFSQSQQRGAALPGLPRQRIPPQFKFNHHRAFKGRSSQPRPQHHRAPLLPFPPSLQFQFQIQIPSSHPLLPWRRFCALSCCLRPLSRLLCPPRCLPPCLIVASVDYRHAPEHRLPAAFDDARDALLWAQSAVFSDPWVHDFADPTKLFLMGCSAGANICYHAALDLIGSKLDLSPLRLSGLILNQPYFGGIDRTASESALVDDMILPLPANDLLWELALPLGADRDHKHCNVVANEAKEVKLLQSCFIRGTIGDPLFDRQKLFVEMLRKAGVTVIEKMGSQGHHGVEYLDSDKAAEVPADLKNFVYGIGAPIHCLDQKL